MRSEAAIKGRIAGLRARIPDTRYYAGNEAKHDLEREMAVLTWVLEEV